jgi:hypothetical protein
VPQQVGVQLAAAWAIGSVGLPLAYGPLLILGFGAGLGAFAAGALLVLAGVFAYLVLMANLTPDASRLGATGLGRAGWAGTVAILGSTGWALGWGLTDAAGLGISGRPQLVLLLGGVPFALAAGLLLKNWYATAVCAALTVALAVSGLYALRQSGPDEVTERLRANPLRSRETLYVVSIPGYHPTGQPYGDGLGNGGFAPDDDSVIPPDRYITIVAYGPEELGPSDGACGAVARDSGLYGLTDCTVEPDGLVFYDSGFRRGYQVRVGQVYVVVAGTVAVDHDLLHRMATTVHLASPAEMGVSVEQEGQFYAADAPGYSGHAIGIPQGMEYELTNHASGMMGVFMDLAAERVGAVDYCRDAVCQPDGDDLTYVRGNDGIQWYVQRRGDVDVVARGGALVDRGLLRRTALAARPATDDEIIRGLNPARPTGLYGRLRRWLRDHT